MTAQELQVEFDERVGIIHNDGGLPLEEAKRLATGEVLDHCGADLPDGITGELIGAVRRRQHSEVEPALGALGLLGKRAPAWGVGHIISEGRTYRPAAAGEHGQAALIVPAMSDGALVDLVAQDLATERLYVRLDVAAVVGEDEIEQARLTGRPLLVFATIDAWLRAGARGVVVIDWRRAGAAFDGNPAILAPSAVLERIAKATWDCHPRPIIATPRTSHAA